MKNLNWFLVILAVVAMASKCQESEIFDDDLRVNHMQNIPTQDTGTTELTADEFNQVPDELENFITSTGQTLSSGDLSQIAKASATYAGGADFYTDSGVENAYVLTPIGDRKYPASYSVGQRVRFIAANPCSITECTIRVGGLATVPVSRTILDNGETPLVVGGDIGTGYVNEAVYLTTPDGLTPYFLITDFISISKLLTGNALIEGSAEIQFRATKTGAPEYGTLILRAGADITSVEGRKAISYRSETSGFNAALTKDGWSFQNDDSDVVRSSVKDEEIKVGTTVNDIGASLNRYGIRYTTALGSTGSVDSMMVEYDAVGTGWGSEVSGFYENTTDFTLTGLPFGVRIRSIHLSDELSGDHYGYPVAFKIKDVASVAVIDSMKCFGYNSPAVGSHIKLTVEVDVRNLIP